MKKPSYRKFDYTPRFYKPSEDPEERKKRKLGFTHERKFIKKKKSPIRWIVLILVVLYLYLKFGGYI